MAVLHATRRHGRCRAYRARPNQAFGPPFTGENDDQPTIDFLGHPISIDKPSNPSSCFQHLDWSFLQAENLWNQTLNRWSKCIGFIFWMFLEKHGKTLVTKAVVLDLKLTKPHCVRSPFGWVLLTWLLGLMARTSSLARWNRQLLVPYLCSNNMPPQCCCSWASDMQATMHIHSCLACDLPKSLKNPGILRKGLLLKVAILAQKIWKISKIQKNQKATEKNYPRIPKRIQENAKK